MFLKCRLVLRFVFLLLLNRDRLFPCSQKCGFDGEELLLSLWFIWFDWKKKLKEKFSLDDVSISKTFWFPDHVEVCHLPEFPTPVMKSFLAVCFAFDRLGHYDTHRSVWGKRVNWVWWLTNEWVPWHRWSERKCFQQLVVSHGWTDRQTHGCVLIKSWADFRLRLWLGHFNTQICFDANPS